MSENTSIPPVTADSSFSRVMLRWLRRLLETVQNVRSIPLAVWTLFAVSFALRLLFLILVSQNFTSDDLWNFFPDTTVYSGVAEYLSSFSPELEEYVLVSGPGYGFIIYILTKLVGASAWAHLFIQVVISALSSVLIRQLALQLDLDSPVATLAGYVHAFSLSALYLSCSLLTETWYVFLSLLSLLMFLKAYKTGRLSHYLLFACLSFAAAMVRSIGLLHPLALGALVALFLLPIFRDRRGARRVFWRPLVFAALSLVLTLGWATRNYVKHGVFSVSETGVSAARIYWVASVIAPERTLEDVNAVRMAWYGEIAKRYGASMTLLERHEFDVSVVRDSVSKYPEEHIRSYGRSVWENMTHQSFHQYKLVPQWIPLWNELSRRFLAGMGKYVVCLTLVGFAALALSGRRRTAAFLLMFYALYALTSGITFWQSSRIFFPAEPFWAISCSFTLLWITRLVRARVSTIRSSRTFPGIQIRER